MDKLSARKEPTRKALKDSSLKALKPDPDGARQTIWDSLMPGMAVRVSALGKRSFYAVKRRAGDTQPTWALLGVYPVMGLGEAREAARQALIALMDGRHPKTLAEEKRRATEAASREAATNTFAAVAEDFIRQRLSEIKSGRVLESRVRRELIPAFGPRPIAEVKRRDIIALVEKIKERSGKEAARGALATLSMLLNWAVARERLDVNLAAMIKPKDILGDAVARKRLLSDEELTAIWRAAPTVGEPFATVYRLLMLTGARRQEIAEARWGDFDEVKATLLVPPERTKNGEAMLIPLCEAAVKLIAAMPRFAGAYIFSTTGGRVPIQALSQAKARLDAAIAIAEGTAIPAWVVHDLRRAARSNLGRLGVVTHVAELCLGHKQKGIVGVYDQWSYLDEKRDALRKWEAHLIGIVEPPPGNVVDLPARATA